MSLSCPKCQAADSLEITHVLELPPVESDELTLQIIKCRQCGLHALATYEERRWGRLDRESVNRACYVVPEDELTQLAGLMESCPARWERDCQCPAHRELGKLDADGKWRLPGSASSSERYLLD